MSAPGEKNPGGDLRKWSRELGPFLTLGLQLAITVVVFFFLGRWADGEFGTNPWLTLLGLAIGVTGGFVKFFRTALKLGDRSDKSAGDKNGNG